MSLKAFVSSPTNLAEYKEYLDKKKEAVQKSLASAVEPYQVYRLQGQIEMIEKLKYIQEDLKNGDL